jgi:TolB-like protein/DNA-binding winged helix-turn-helix (wHTH) protein/Tfp pilus assembly protein PilF
MLKEALSMSDPGQASRVLRFGNFEVDLRAGELYRQGRQVKLQEQPFQVLAMLLERPGEVVTRQEVQERLWTEDTFVDFDHSLNVAIKKVRDALGDSADSPRFIQTVARRGYRFIAPVEDEGRPSTPRTDRFRRRQVWLVLSFLVATCLAVGYVAWDQFRPPLRQEADKIMLVVLPFENFTGDPEQEYFSDGLTEEMITELGRLHPERLGVIARTSSMHYKNTEKRADQIGEELGVDYVLEGSVRQDSERVRITAQLIQVGDQTHLWARSYDRHRGEILALQRDVARAIVEEIEIKLTPEQELHLAGQVTVNQEAYENYLKGLYFWNKVTPDALRKSVDHFRQAIAQDPSYALPYAGLSAAYAVMGYQNMLPPHDAYKEAKMATVKALELDETAEPAHAQLGFIALFYEHDWARAERAFQRAIALNPSAPNAHKGEAYVHVTQGRFEQALAAIERARKLDPLSALTNADVGYILYLAREYDQAAEQLQETLAWEPNFGYAHMCLALVYAAKGLYREALTEEVIGWRLASVETDIVEAVERDFEESGWRGMWQGRLKYMLKMKSEGGRVPAAHLAEIYIRLDDKDNALAWLERAIQERNHQVAFLAVDPKFDPLRSDPRFQDILWRLNLPRLP